MELRQSVIACHKRSSANRQEMIEQVLHSGNIMKALRQVQQNKGSAGIDGLKTNQLYT